MIKWILTETNVKLCFKHSIYASEGWESPDLIEVPMKTWDFGVSTSLFESPGGKAAGSWGSPELCK